MSGGFMLDLSAHFDRLRAELREELKAELLVELQALAAPSPFLTIPQAARYIGIEPEFDEAGRLEKRSRQRIDDLLSSGRLTRHKEGGRTLISRAELEAHVVEERRRSR